MDKIDDIKLLEALMPEILLEALAHETVSRNYVLETALVGTWKALIKKGLINARDLDEEIDIISAHYPSRLKNDPGVRLLKELKKGVHAPSSKYVENVFPLGEASNDPVM